MISIGSPIEIKENPASVTGAFLRSERRRLWPFRSLDLLPWLTIHRASANDLDRLAHRNKRKSRFGHRGVSSIRKETAVAVSLIGSFAVAHDSSSQRQ